MSEESIIHDRGRGPEIRGTRITVYDILDYHKRGRSPEYIATILPVSPEQIRAAIQYIEAHADEVMPKYEKMLALAEAGNPPHIEAMFAKSREEQMAKLKRLLREKQEGSSDARVAG